MDKYNLIPPKYLDNNDIAELSELDDDDIPEAKFCEHCARIFNDNSYERWSKFWCYWEKVRNRHPYRLPRTARPGIHHLSLQSMKESADRGCYICSRLVERASFYPDQFPLRYSLRALTRRVRESVEGDYTLEFGMGDGGHGNGTFDIRLKSPLTTLRQLGYRSKCRTSTGHDDTTRIAKFWVNECLTTHVTCSKRFPMKNEWKPSRLLDVSGEKVKLVSGTSDEARECPYVTLSHCWGSRPFSVLNATSMPLYIEGVDISQFEPTFRNVIETVRQLGIRYLWIDCYCIIQGSDAEAVADWKYESLRMRDIYANSLLNIGAIHSDGPFKGLFSDFGQDFRNRSVNGNMVWSSTRAYGKRSFYIVAEANETDLWRSFNELSFSRLLKRGWVLQECALAPRMLSYGHHIFWQCSELAASEVSPEGTPIRSLGNRSRKSMEHPFWTLKHPGTAQRNGTLDFRVQWMRTFSNYCESRLTYPDKDVFVALNGMGSELLKVSGGLFMYGIWDSTLLETLLYNVFQSDEWSRGGKPSTRNQVMPTWHWASCYPYAQYIENMILNEKLPLNRKPSPMAYAFMSNECKPLPDERSKDLWPSLFLIGRLLSEIPEICPQDLDTLKDIEDVSSEKVLSYLPIFYDRKTAHRRPVDSEICGLILLQSKSGAYRRVGSWRSFKPVSSNETRTDFHDQIVRTKPQIVVLE